MRRIAPLSRDNKKRGSRSLISSSRAGNVRTFKCRTRAAESESITAWNMVQARIKLFRRTYVFAPVSLAMRSKRVMQSPARSMMAVNSSVGQSGLSKTQRIDSRSAWLIASSRDWTFGEMSMLIRTYSGANRKHLETSPEQAFQEENCRKSRAAK